VLTGARAAAKRQHDRGEEWRWLELGARAKEGARELGREGKRGGEGRGCLSPLIETERAPGGVARVVTVGINDFNAIEGGEL
jgi:hypothetical protein